MATIAWFKGHQFFDDSGNPLNAGTINIYDPGTTSTRTVYQDADEGTPWSQPITLNSAGRLTASIYVPAGDWKFVLKNSAGSTITTEDDIPGATAPLSTTFGRPVRPVITKAANYTVTTDDIGSLFVVDPTGGDVTLTLPAAVNVTSGTGIDVIHVGTANSVIIDGNGSETVGGATTYPIRRRLGSAGIVSDGATSWALENAEDVVGWTSLASATTTNLAAAASQNIRMTGTATVTSLGNAQAGLRRFVSFAAGITLTHSAALALPTNANIVTTDGDYAIFFVYQDNFWLCEFYQRDDGRGIGLAATDSPQFAGINLGHASDTTLTRAGAGDVNIEGNIAYRAGGTDVPVTDGGTGASSAASARTNLGIVAYDVYTGTTASNTTFPVGTIVTVNSGGASIPDRAGTAAPKLHDSDAKQYSLGGAGSALSGTWNSRGYHTEGGSVAFITMQRTA